MIILNANKTVLYCVGGMEEKQIFHVTKEEFNLAIALIENICLTGTGNYDGNHSIKCIKIIRQTFNIGLAEAKHAYDAARTHKFPNS